LRSGQQHLRRVDAETEEEALCYRAVYEPNLPLARLIDAGPAPSPRMGSRLLAPVRTGRGLFSTLRLLPPRPRRLARCRSPCAEPLYVRFGRIAIKNCQARSQSANTGNCPTCLVELTNGARVAHCRTRPAKTFRQAGARCGAEHELSLATAP